MRLLRRVQSNGTTTSTDLSLTEYSPLETPPRYAILSHRWGADEVTLKDFKKSVAKTKVGGYQKLEFCARQAALDGINYFWVDTCCIDKANYTELSEAINSMFRWYRNAAKCYVYLPDVSITRGKRDINGEVKWRAAFQRSEWFTRGWTLQELIAPTVVEFFSKEGEKLGDKRSLEQEICQTTKIPASALQGQALSQFGIEERMSWANSRCTTKDEDFAYCLLGIFEVHMPLIYGEGRDEAVARLRRKFRSVHAEDRECHQTFKTSSYEARKDRNPLRVPGTCQWVLSHPQFCDWRSSQHHSLLWISADPGCGKSVLCRSLIDQDLSESWQSSVCYYFFRDNGEQDSLATALCAILHQLFDQQPHLLHYARPAWDKNKAQIQHETQELWRIFHRATADQTADPVICVLDALDECRDDDRCQLISELCGIHRRQGGTTPQKLKVLATSRPYDKVQRWFAPITAQWPQIRLRGEDENERIHHEINLVIDQRVLDLATEFDLPLADRQNLRQQMLQMQHRTYLWLYLATEEVREACRESIFSNSLQIDSLPSSVEDAYERILGRVGDRQRLHAQKVLLIIVGARRPLSIGEMAMALSAANAGERDAQRLDAIDAIRLEKHIREECGLFVYIQHSQLFLIHQTAKEFLMARSTTLCHAQVGWRSSLSGEIVESQMARLCMTYLCLHAQQECLPVESQDESSVLGGRHQPGSVQLNRFFQYCAEHWTSHLQDDMLRGEDKLMRQALWLYRVDRPSSRSWFSNAWRALNPHSDLSNTQIQHAIAIFGHAVVLDEVLRLEPIDLEKLDNTGRTALHWAAVRGHEKVVQVLLDKGADINAQGERNANALYGASAYNHEKVVQILLEKGADVSARGGCYDSALHTALERGHEKIFQMLLDRGADLNAEEGRYGSVLYVASKCGYDKIVLILLDKGADVNARGGECGSALQAASASGHKKVVQILLDKGADINARGGDHGSALQAASRGGHEKVVQMLLDRGADVDARGGLYGSALYTASAGGYEQVVQMLLDQGTDINARGRRGGALYAASDGGHEKVVQMLLDRGADVDARGGLYGSVLRAASEGGHKKVVQILLQYGAKR